jgi:hypothetical protein
MLRRAAATRGRRGACSSRRHRDALLPANTWPAERAPSASGWGGAIATRGRRSACSSRRDCGAQLAAFGPPGACPPPAAAGGGGRDARTAQRVLVPIAIRHRRHTHGPLSARPPPAATGRGAVPTRGWHIACSSRRDRDAPLAADAWAMKGERPQQAAAGRPVAPCDLHRACVSRLERATPLAPQPGGVGCGRDTMHARLRLVASRARAKAQKHCTSSWGCDRVTT